MSARKGSHNCLRFWEDSVEMDAEVQDFRSLGTNGTAKDDGRRRNGDQET